MLKDSKGFSSFAVPDLTAAKDFYGQTLGLTVAEEDMGTLNIQLSGGASVMVYPKPDHEPAVYTVLNFMVKDLDGAVDDLTAKGVKFERYENFKHDDKGIVRSGDDNPGPSIAWFKDPAGNVLAVMEEA